MGGLGLGASATAGTAGKGAAPAIVPRTAAEALALVELVDQHEIRLAEQARSKGVSGPALEYATMMLAHHTPHLQQTRTLRGTADAAATTGTSVQTLTAMSQQAESQLAALSGEAYARAYIDRMVLDHQMALQMVNASMGVARDARVRDHLTATRKTMQAHLDRARALQRQLAR